MASDGNEGEQIGEQSLKEGNANSSKPIYYNVPCDDWKKIEREVRLDLECQSATTTERDICALRISPPDLQLIRCLCWVISTSSL